MNKILTLVLCGLLFVSSASARQSKEEEGRLGKMRSDKFAFRPEDKNIPDFVRENRFKMSIRADEFKEIKGKMDNFTQIMNSTIGLEILQKPIIKMVKTIDVLYFHPSYITTIILPEGSKIDSVSASFETKNKTTFFENVINIRPKKSLLNGNIVIFYSKDRKNYTMNIIAKNYATAECRVDSENRRYLCDDDVFGTVYSYKEAKKYDESDIFFAYVDISGDKMSEINKLGFASVIFKGETYYIIKDNKFGKIFFRGSRYRIANRM